MIEQNLSNFSESFCARPIPLKFSRHAEPRNRLSASSYETADSHVMRFRRRATRSVGDDVDIEAITHRMDSGHRETHLRPECGDHKFLAARLLDCIDNAAVLPRINERAVDGFLVRKNSLYLPENFAAAFCGDCCENRWDAIRLRGLCQTCDVVDHHRWLVTIYVRQLRRLVIDEKKDAIIWS